MSVFSRVARLVKSHPWIVIGVCLVLTAVMFIGVLFLRGQVTYRSLLPDDFPSVKALDKLDKTLGGIAYEYVLIRAPSVTDPRIVQFLISLPDYLMEKDRFHPGDVQTAKDAEGKTVPVVQDYLTPFIVNMQREMKSRGFDVPLSTITNESVKLFTGKDFQQIVEQDYLSNPAAAKELFGRFITRDKKAALVIIKTGAKLSDKEQMSYASTLEKLFREKLAGVRGVRIDIAGDATLANDFDRHIRNKTILLFLVAMAFVLLTLFLSFRRFSDTALPIVVMIIGLVWTLGFMGFVGIPYSIAAIAIIPLMLGTALTFVVPFVARYYEEIELDFRSVEAVGKGLMTIGVGIFLAAITNVFGFLVFEFSVLPALRDFGLSCAIGTAFIFLLSVIMLPAIMVVRDRFYEKPAEGKAGRKTTFDGLSRRKKRGLFARGTDKVLEAFGVLATRHAVLLIILFTLFIAFGFVQLRTLKTDSDLRKLVPKNLPGINADYQIEKYFGGQQQDVVLVEGDVLSPEGLKAMAAFEDGVASVSENIFEGRRLYERKGMTGLPDVLASANNGKMPISRAEALSALKTAEDNGGFVEGGLISEDKKAALVTLNAAGAESTAAVDAKLKTIRQNAQRYLKKAGLAYVIGGITPLTKDMTKNIIPTELLSSVIALVLCAFILVVIFRSVPYGFITLTVAIAGVAGEVAFLALMGWPIDIVTSLVSALVIGIGVNFGILFTHRYMQEIDLEGRTPIEALKSTMMNLGRANVVAGLASVGAFLIVMLSDVVPLRRFGGVTAFAIGWCLVTSLTLMPALLYKLSGYRESKEEAVAVPVPDVSA